jgi:hypothetical protein
MTADQRRGNDGEMGFLGEGCNSLPLSDGTSTASSPLLSAKHCMPWNSVF